MVDSPERLAYSEASTEAAPLGPTSAKITSAEEAPAVFAGRYEILGMLGAGGMGTVYRARDRELDELVALKVLKKELASTGGMLERFRREVKLARRVTHKNVARTFDIGEHQGDHFLTMELIEGEMLGALLARRGRISSNEAIQIAQDVCAGLSVAHAAGVLHRDLKPENVIIARDGRAVITDFGIARALSQAEPGRTVVGGLVGTPAYMAPEQVEGATDLDARADLYALGAMMFELLSGKPAWPGASPIAIAASRILHPPPDVRAHLPTVSPALAELVLKLMARQRSDRFSDADEARAALGSVASPDGDPRSIAPLSLSTAAIIEPGRASRKIVGVLPLLNLGADDDAYLAQTLTEDLVDLLSMVPELRLRPRGDTARYSERARDVREAGRALGVDVVVDGSLRRIGESVRVSVRMITVEDGFQLWAQRFDRAPAAVLTVADEAASAIAHALTAERVSKARPVQADAIAQELYLRGRYLLHGGWFEVSRGGVDLLREAHRRAPDDTRIAGTYALAVARVLTADPDSYELGSSARELAEKTLETDPSQSEARVALGFIHLNNAEGASAAQQLKRALATSPNSIEALDVVGRVLIEVGCVELGVATLRRALSIEPNMVLASESIARAYALVGDIDSMNALLGPITGDDGKLRPHLFSRARFALWRADTAAAQAMFDEVALRSDISEKDRARFLGVLGVMLNGKAASEDFSGLDVFLPLDKRFTPRRMGFHAQLRTELRLAVNDIEGTIEELRTADRCGLSDLLWIEKCPLFRRIEGRPELAAIRESTRNRAERIIRVLAPS